MQAIRIISKIPRANRRMLNRAADRQEELAVTDSAAFCRVGRNLYAPLHNGEDGISIHAVARRMMVAARTTFSYEILQDRDQT
jgi:hypothetical protein